MSGAPTPAPWHIGVRQPDSAAFIYGADGAEVADCDRLTNFPDVNLANANLIAAAPELLEELYRALPFVEDALKDPAFKRGVVAMRVKKIRAAIAKAEGKS